MIDPKQVTAVVVTRGNVDLTEILKSLECFGSVIVWDNSKRENLSVFGRYAAVTEAKFPVVAVFDDDCVLENPAAICEHYEPGVVTCNMPPEYRRNYQYPEGIRLVGFGAIFDAHLTKVLADFEHDALFLRECDRVFTSLNQCKLVDLPFKHLPAAYAPDRLWRQPGHAEALAEIRSRIRAAKEMNKAIKCGWAQDYPEDAGQGPWCGKPEPCPVHGIMKCRYCGQPGLVVYGHRVDTCEPCREDRSGTWAELVAKGYAKDHDAERWDAVIAEMRSRVRPPPEKVDILYLAWERPEFTRESLRNLLLNTDWSKVGKLWVYTDGPESHFLVDILGRMKCEFELAISTEKFGAPVAIMNDFLERSTANLFIKLDNDVIVPPGWLDEGLRLMGENPQVDLLGIEAHLRPPIPYGTVIKIPLEKLGPTPPPLHDIRYTDHIGGIGFMRRRAFEASKPTPIGDRQGFTQWMWDNPQVLKCWIDPPLRVFLLDHLPFEPWRSLSAQYFEKGWQRRQWGEYGPEWSGLWEWWENAQT